MYNWLYTGVCLLFQKSFEKEISKKKKTKERESMREYHPTIGLLITRTTCTYMGGIVHNHLSVVKKYNSHHLPAHASAFYGQQLSKKGANAKYGMLEFYF